jgi:hypothetical protein
MIIQTEEKIIKENRLYNYFTLTDDKTGKVKAEGEIMVSDNELLALYNSGETELALQDERMETLLNPPTPEPEPTQPDVWDEMAKAIKEGVDSV